MKNFREEWYKKIENPVAALFGCNPFVKLLLFCAGTRLNP
jgi:hypothetical protein